MNFKNKYLKYKFKYLELKKQIGGSKEIIDKINSKIDSGKFICLGHITSLDNAFKILNHGYFVPAPIISNLKRPVSIKYKYPENEYDFDYYLYMFFTNHLKIKNLPSGDPITLENVKVIKEHYFSEMKQLKKIKNKIIDDIKETFNMWLRDELKHDMALYEDILTRYKRLAGSTALTKLWKQNPSGQDQIKAIWFSEINKLSDNDLSGVGGWHKEEPIKIILLLPKDVAYTDYYYYTKKTKNEYLKDDGPPWPIPKNDIAKSKDEIKKKFNDFLNTRGRYKAEIIAENIYNNFMEIEETKNKKSQDGYDSDDDWFDDGLKKDYWSSLDEASKEKLINIEIEKLKEENLCCHKVESKFFIPKGNELLTQFDVDTEFIKLVVVPKHLEEKMRNKMNKMNKIKDNKFKDFEIVYV
jgi:hypothetical protein